MGGSNDFLNGYTAELRIIKPMEFMRLIGVSNIFVSVNVNLTDTKDSKIVAI